MTFITEATDAEVIYVPRKAIVEENGKYYIYKKEQDEYVLSPIETGFTTEKIWRLSVDWIKMRHIISQVLH